MDLMIQRSGSVLRKLKKLQQLNANWPVGIGCDFGKLGKVDVVCSLWRSLLACEGRVRELLVFVRSTTLPAYQYPHVPMVVLAAADRFSLGYKKPDAMAGFSEQVAVGKILTMAK